MAIKTMSRDKSYVLVTGASGFVGVNIVKCLAQRGRDTIGLDKDVERPRPLLRDYLEGLEDRIDWVEVDLTDYENVIQLADRYRISGVIHAAVFTAVGREVERARAREILSTNLMGTVNTLELARKAGARRFVYVSSSGLYGSTSDLSKPVTEDSAEPYLRMSGFYGITKISSEKLTERYSQLFPMTTTSMRIAAPYGCMERPTGSRSVMGLIYNLLKLVLVDKKKMIRVRGLDYARDWTYVMDTAQGLVLGLDSAEPVSSLYNVSSGVNSTLEEILKAIQEVSGLGLEWEEVGKGQEADIVASGGMRGPLSIEKARRELGFNPKYDLKKGIRKYCEWWMGLARKGLQPH